MIESNTNYEKKHSKIKVFHLEIDGEHHYFGSPKAIFDIIGEERLGMKYGSFHSNISLKVGDVYTNRRRGYIIRVGELGQAKTNRGNRWGEIIERSVADALAARTDQSATSATTPSEPVNTTPAAPTPSPKADTPVRKTRKKKNDDNPQQLTLF